MAEIVIVGGGITGLAAAYFMAKDGHKVKVLEAAENFGGLLNTFEIGGNRLEFYYHHFFTHDAELNWLIKDLKLEDKLVFHDSTMGVYRKSKTYNFNTPLDLLKFSPLTFLDKIRFGFTSIFLGKIADWKKYEHISTLSWLYKYAGKGVTNSLWKPLLNIKFGPFADKVPLTWMIGRLRQRMNSRKKGDERLGYLDGSLVVLLDSILLKLNELGVELINNAPVKELLIQNNKLDNIITPKGNFTADKFLFTIPTIYLAPLIENANPQYAAQLKRVEYFGAVCTIAELTKPLSKIYWLNVADDGFPFGGIIEHTNLISASKYNGSHIAYLSRYFAMEEDIAKMKEDEIEAIMLNGLYKIYPDLKPQDIKNVRVFRTNTAATVCDLNFSEKVPDCKSPIENLYLATMAHVYPDERSTNNAIRVAAEACGVMGIDASYVPYGSSLSGKIGFNNKN